MSIARLYDSLKYYGRSLYWVSPTFRQDDFSALLTKVETAGGMMIARYTKRVFSVVGTIEMCFNQSLMIYQRQMAPSLISKAQSCKPDFSHTPSTHIYMMRSISMLYNVDLLKGCVISGIQIWEIHITGTFPSTPYNFDLCVSPHGPHLCCGFTSPSSRLCIGCSNHQSKANVRPKTLLGRRVDSHLKLFVEQNAFYGFPSAAKLERSFGIFHPKCPDLITLSMSWT